MLNTKLFKWIVSGSQIFTFGDVLLNLMNDLRVNILQGSLLVDLPSLEDVFIVGVAASPDLFIDAHELKSLLHLGQTRPVLDVFRNALLLVFEHRTLVNTPEFFGGEGAIHHQDASDEEFRAGLVEFAILVLAGSGIGSNRWFLELSC